MYGQKEIKLIETNTLEERMSYKVTEGGVLHFNFLDKKEELCYLVAKKESGYGVALMKL